jgi:outer membrane protein assembly factor BamB
MARRGSATNELVFVAFNSRVFALNRRDGCVVWRWKGSGGAGSGVPILMPDGDRIIVCINGYTWALNALSGEQLWYQPFEGEGTGIPSLASGSAASLGTPAAAQAAAQAAAAAASAAAVTAASASAAAGAG